MNGRSLRGIRPADATVQNSTPPAELKQGLTPGEVEKVAGKPKDTVKLKDSVVYIYPAYKVIFENGKVTDVQTPDAVGK